jgi:hypothetical protein
MAQVVVWALPSEWEHLELFAPGLDDRVATRVRSNVADSGLQPGMVDALVESQLHVARRARDAGVLLMASYGEGAGTFDDPLSLLSLTLAFGHLPPNTATSSRSEAKDTSGAGSTFASSVTPLVVEDPDLTAFVREQHSTLPLADGDEELRQFQVQVHLVSSGSGLVLALTVTTPDPAREEQALVVAREVASTVRVIDVDSEVA